MTAATERTLCSPRVLRGGKEGDSGESVLNGSETERKLKNAGYISAAVASDDYGYRAAS